VTDRGDKKIVTIHDHVRDNAVTIRMTEHQYKSECDSRAVLSFTLSLDCDNKSGHDNT